MTSIQSSTAIPLTADTLLQSNSKENKDAPPTAESKKSIATSPANKKGLSLAQLNKLDSGGFQASCRLMF